jgi:hypothetical protein
MKREQRYKKYDGKVTEMHEQLATGQKSMGKVLANVTKSPSFKPAHETFDLNKAPPIPMCSSSSNVSQTYAMQHPALEKMNAQLAHSLIASGKTKRGGFKN